MSAETEVLVISGRTRMCENAKTSVDEDDRSNFILKKKNSLIPGEQANKETNKLITWSSVLFVLVTNTISDS